MLTSAGDAYNLWWGNSKRFKQSKWLDIGLEEMDGKVNAMLKLIEQDADSFGKKADLYFRRRPELIHYVEEMYKSYKSLADRYGRMLEELNKANHTLAFIFPDQVEFDEEDEGGSPLKADTSLNFSKHRIRSSPDLAQLSRMGMNRNEHVCLPRNKTLHRRRTSQISQEQAEEETERLQKELLMQQTEKEFIRSCYEGTFKRYLQIEKKITETQEEISRLKDAHSARAAVIEDDEARALMAAAAIRSCEDSLVSIHEKRKASSEETRMESERIKDAKRQLSTLRGERHESQVVLDHATAAAAAAAAKSSDECTETASFNFLKGEAMELRAMCEKVKEHLGTSSAASVVDLEEKIEDHVDEVIDLEVTVQTQTAQIKRLNEEIDELHEHLRNLENEKTLLVDNSNSLTTKLKEAEDELQRVLQLERCIHHNNGILEKQFIEVCHSLSSFSEKLMSPNIQQEANSDELLDENSDDDAAEADESLRLQNGVLEGELQAEIKELLGIPDLQELLLHAALLWSYHDSWSFL